MRYDLKIEYSNNDELNNLIQETYFADGNNGKISKTKKSIVLDKEDPLTIAFRGLNNVNAKISNKDLIDGSMRFIVNEENGGIELIPCSIYCIIDEHKKYSFY